MHVRRRPSFWNRTAGRWLTLALLGLLAIGLAGCADAIPERQSATPVDAVVVEIEGGGAAVNTSIDWPYRRNGGRVPPPADGRFAAGTRHTALARLPGDEWLRVPSGWVSASRVRFVTGTMNDVPILLDRGLWLIALDDLQEPLLVTGRPYWNSWQWDPEGDALWYRHSEASPVPWYGYSPVSRLALKDGGFQRAHYRLFGEVLAAPAGGAVLVRGFDPNQPHDNVHILEADGTVHAIAQQCGQYFTDSYIPFGRHAAWSPDGQYVALRDRTGDFCDGGGITIYDRNGAVERDLTDRNSPYRQAWYRNPNFGDQVGTNETCADRPPGVQLNERRNRCQWSPDRQWFATMPGAVDSPWLANLLIYRADGTLVRRFLIIGWPCNTFQWSPDSQWLAYGGPSGCA